MSQSQQLKIAIVLCAVGAVSLCALLRVLLNDPKSASTEAKEQERKVATDRPSKPLSVNGSSQLTTEQRAAWERARGKWDKNSRFVFALVGVNQGKWMAVTGETIYSYAESSGYAVKCRTTLSLVGTEFPMEIGWVIQQGGFYPDVRPSVLPDVAAKLIAAEPAIQYSVLVDLATGPNPVAVSWYRSDGSQVKASVKPSTSAVEQSFAQHMLYMQKHIGD